jgi:hypothetical protein
MADPVAIKRAEAEEVWRSDMEQLGRDVVRTRFIARMPITDRMPYPDSNFVQNWLDQKDQIAKIRTALVTAVSVVAMIAACIAAWPVVKGWLN